MIAFFVFRSFVVIVPVGHAGVVYDLTRGVLKTPLFPGIHFLIPIVQRSTLFNTQIQEYTMSIAPDEGALKRDDSLDAPTSDGQQVKVDASILFYIKPENASKIWETLGQEYVTKIIRPVSRSQIRMVVSRYSAMDIYSGERAEAEKIIENEIRSLLEEKGLSLDKVLLRGVYFSAEYARAIESKQVAQQRIKQAEFEKEEAIQRAEAKVNEAKGLAEAQTLQRQTLTSEYLQLEAIKKWDGKLPQVNGSSNTPFINIPLR